VEQFFGIIVIVQPPSLVKRVKGKGIAIYVKAVLEKKQGSASGDY
jgi:hypothetical protein